MAGTGGNGRDDTPPAGTRARGNGSAADHRGFDDDETPPPTSVGRRREERRTPPDGVPVVGSTRAANVRLAIQGSARHLAAAVTYGETIVDILETTRGDVFALPDDVLEQLNALAKDSHYLHHIAGTDDVLRWLETELGDFAEEIHKSRRDIAEARRRRRG